MQISRPSSVYISIYVFFCFSFRSAIIESVSGVRVSIVINIISVSNYCKYCSVICN